MTSLPKLPQPKIIIRQRRQITRRHGRSRSSPKHWVSDIHHSSREMIIDQILRRLHGQHRHHAHSHGGAGSRWPGELVRTSAEKDGLKDDGGGYS